MAWHQWTDKELEDRRKQNDLYVKQNFSIVNDTNANVLTIFETLSGQNVKPRIYKGVKRKVLLWIINKFFNRL
jgi:hypothetical protein